MNKKDWTEEDGVKIVCQGKDILKITVKNNKIIESIKIDEVKENNVF